MLFKNVPETSNALHFPTDDSILSLWNCKEFVGFSNKLTPPTIADSHCPVRMAYIACDKANKLPEHAVSKA